MVTLSMLRDEDLASDVAISIILLSSYSDNLNWRHQITFAFHIEFSPIVRLTFPLNFSVLI